MQSPGEIKIKEYNYPLPEERIAKYPLKQRDLSKLLFFKEGDISEKKFKEIPDLMPEGSLLLFNETKVIQARMKFRKESQQTGGNQGAKIEIFCLEPVEPENDFQLAFQLSSPVVWKCMIGNAKRWKSGKLKNTFVYKGKEITLEAEIKARLSDAWLVRFGWNLPEIKFHEIIEQNGLTPLPPYLNREAEESDKDRYQTVYANYNGSVAAPTAGLHFTQSIIGQIKQRGIQTAKLTLHVGAGTFKPVSAEKIAEHEMHTEKVVVSMGTLLSIKSNLKKSIIPVGTTSMRTLESLYWMALKLKNGDSSFSVEQWDPYQLADEGFSSSNAIDLLISFLKENNRESLSGETRLMIAPGYKFRFATGLITNFHQPKSTLLLLVSALIGEQWKDAYNFALANDFRFLSYGDSCLFL